MGSESPQSGTPCVEVPGQGSLQDHGRRLTPGPSQAGNLPAANARELLRSIKHSAALLAPCLFLRRTKRRRPSASAAAPRPMRFYGTVVPGRVYRDRIAGRQPLGAGPLKITIMIGRETGGGALEAERMAAALVREVDAKILMNACFAIPSARFPTPRCFHRTGCKF